MKTQSLLLLFSFFFSYTLAQNGIESSSLDKTNPITFAGTHITYQGKKITLNPKHFFVDGQLSDEVVAKYPFVFNSINEALKHITDGTQAEPMVLHIAPYVYWIDNPNDETIHKPIEGGIPYGKIVKCNWLRFCGLTEDAQNVVLASWRGQTQGAVGNFTMFYFDGDGISSENLTFGNYCNVDLDFPLLPKLSKKRRSSTITQAQLIICNSDKVVARNTRFISRLNLCPFAAAKRIIFDRCYFESTDDALCSTGVYLGCKFTFYGSKPFYNTQGTGAVFLNCDFDVQTKNKQYLTKAVSPVTIVDSRFQSSSAPLFIGWTQDPTDDLRCYQYNVSLNGTPIRISNNKPEITVDMTDKPILEAYRLEHKGKVLYNTYNLLRGNDDWDPMGVKEAVLQLEKQTGKNLTQIPTYLKIAPGAASIESGVTAAQLTATVKRFGNFDAKELVAWTTSPQNQHVVTLNRGADNTCQVVGVNEKEETTQAIINATTALGIESASALTVSPKFLDAPGFTSSPQLEKGDEGTLKVNYTINLEGRADQSLITWYRCADAKGNQPIEVAVSRLNQPEYTYALSDADLGYYIQVAVAPKHLRCNPGQWGKAITTTAIAPKDIVSKRTYYTNFQNFSVASQPRIIPGFWTVDGYKPLGLEEFGWDAPSGETWYYGTGVDGIKGYGLAQTHKGARLLYTPVKGTYGDMEVTLNVDPGKQGGQGFGSATGQYLDVYIKFDTQALTGYGLRIMRTTKFDNAVDFTLMKYENGVATAISLPVSTTCYRTNCTITIAVTGNLLTAYAHTQTELTEPTHPELKKNVDLRADITPTTAGGVGMQHTGSTGPSATMIHWMQLDWK